jgi:hypothetical protein
MIAIEDEVISASNYKKHVLKDPNTTNDTCRKCQERPQTIQHITAACPALAQRDYTHRNSQVANIGHQMWTVKVSTSAVL